jgi:quinol monooxygenase YgiN
MKEKTLPFHCQKCNLSFTPKHPNQVPQAQKQLATHEQHCEGNISYNVISYSTTEPNGSHTVYRTWKRR